MRHFNYFLFVLILLTGGIVISNNDLIAQDPSRVFRFENDGETVDLLTLMKVSKTPAVSMAVDNGQIDAAFTAELPGTAEITPQTLFPAGAASALPVCIAVLQLVERGELDLDVPINNYLEQGKLARGESVTLRDVFLMKPRMGSSYKPIGFAVEESLPKLVEIAKSFRFKGMRKPDKGTEYGGWVLLQLLLEQHYEESLNAIIQREVFGPLCLESMVYATELTPAQRKQAVMGHIENGMKVNGGYRRYVAQSDAGLWTTSADYTKLVRTLLDIKLGKQQSILRPETVKAAFAEQYGHRSLLSHINKNGNPYWGGNTKGYYFSMQAHFSEDWVAVVAMNRDLNWRIGSPVVWQLGMLGKQWRADGRLGIIQPVGEADDDFTEELEHLAFIEGVKTERISAADGLPEAISATPAFVYQSSAGRAIYGGRHNDLAAIAKFIRLNQVTPRKFSVDVRTNVLGYKRGRQLIVLPIKLTAPSGTMAPMELPASIVKELHHQLMEKTFFRQLDTVRLNAQDRRLYLDVHSYCTEGGGYQMTYALFSQFDCHTLISSNYGDPIQVSEEGVGLELFATRINVDVTKAIDATLGLVPTSLPATIQTKSWADLGWGLDQSVTTKQVTTTFTEPVAVSGTYRARLTKSDVPGLYFSFPSPLDRYSGEVTELAADFIFSEAGTRLSGRVDLPVASISTTSGSLDTYVLGDILKSEKHPTAQLTFSVDNLPGIWEKGRPVQAVIPARLTIRGKMYPVEVKAEFTPDPDGNLEVAANFGLDFRKVFGRNGPDGPEAIRHQLDFTSRFRAYPQTSK